MYRDARGSRLFTALCKIRCVYVPVVPAFAELDGNRNGNRTADGFNDLRRQIRRFHQCGAVAAPYNLPHRASHVDVKHIRAGCIGCNTCRLCHHIRFMAENLNRCGMLSLRQVQQFHALSVTQREGFRTDHFRRRHCRAAGSAQFTKGKVRHTRHGSKDSVPCEFDISQFHSFRSSPTGQWSDPMISGRI